MLLKNSTSLFVSSNSSLQIWLQPHTSSSTAKIMILPLCQIIISTQKLKLLGKASRYDLYYSLTHLLKWKPFWLETCTSPDYLVFNFYQINRDDEILIRDRLVIKALISYQRTISTQKFKLLNKILKYNLYYSIYVTDVFSFYFFVNRNI
jgi:hypothetical protein